VEHLSLCPFCGALSPSGPEVWLSNDPPACSVCRRTSATLPPHLRYLLCSEGSGAGELHRLSGTVLAMPSSLRPERLLIELQRAGVPLVRQLRADPALVPACESPRPAPCARPPADPRHFLGFLRRAPRYAGRGVWPRDDRGVCFALFISLGILVLAAGKWAFLGHLWGPGPSLASFLTLGALLSLPPLLYELRRLLRQPFLLVSSDRVVWRDVLGRSGRIELADLRALTATFETAPHVRTEVPTEHLRIELTGARGDAVIAAPNLNWLDPLALHVPPEQRCLPLDDEV